MGDMSFDLSQRGAGDQRATLELIQNGAIQMAIVNNAMVENYNKDFSILGLPYIFDSQEHQKGSIYLRHPGPAV